jgi:membrane fusion protein (multidrug efflux system)
MENENKKQEKKKSNKKKIFVGIALVAVIAVGLILFLGGGTESTDNAQFESSVIPVRSSVNGYVKAIHFEDNQQVKKGQLLFEIDDTEYKARVAQAEAALENALANLKAVKNNANSSDLSANAALFSSQSSEQNIQSAQAKLTKAKNDYKRIKNMFDAKAATQSELDGITAELEVAQATYEAAVKQSKAAQSQSAGARSQASGQQSMISLAEAMVRQREAELKLAQTQLEYTTVEAPCNGIVTKKGAEVGQYITLGAPLCSVIDNTQLWIVANFKETQLKRIKVGQAVTVKVDAYPDMEIHGKVNSFGGATGARFALLPPDNATGNFVKIVQRVPVKITLDGLTNEQLERLFPGLSTVVIVKVK